MVAARIQRYLAAAGLAVVTGTAAVGLAIVAVGPLGQVAASVHGAGAALSRGVLSVVMPHDPPPAAASGSAGTDRGGPAAWAPREDAGPANRVRTGTAPTPAPPFSGGSGLEEPSVPDPDIGGGQAEASGLLRPATSLVTAPDAQVSGGDAPVGDTVEAVEQLVDDVSGLAAGVLR